MISARQRSRVRRRRGGLSPDVGRRRDVQGI